MVTLTFYEILHYSCTLDGFKIIIIFFFNRTCLLAYANACRQTHTSENMNQNCDRENSCQVFREGRTKAVGRVLEVIPKMASLQNQKNNHKIMKMVKQVRGFIKLILIHILT